MGSERSNRDDGSDKRNDTLHRILVAVAVALAIILLAALASLFPDSLFARIFIYGFIGIVVLAYLFRGAILKLFG